MKRWQILAATFVVASTMTTGLRPAAAVPAQSTNPCVVALTYVFAPYGRGVQQRFIAISFRESRHTEGIQNKRAVVSRGVNWGRATGCVQVLPRVARNIGMTCDLRTAWCNAATAKKLWLKMGWSPWAVR